MELRHGFHCLADPNRIRIIEILADGRKSVTEPQTHFSMSLPGLLKHIRKLEQGQIIRTTKLGRTVYCELQHSPLELMEHWIHRQTSFWTESLNRLNKELEKKAGPMAGKSRKGR